VLILGGGVFCFFFLSFLCSLSLALFQCLISLTLTLSLLLLPPFAPWEGGKHTNDWFEWMMMNLYLDSPPLVRLSYVCNHCQAKRATLQAILLFLSLSLLLSLSRCWAPPHEPVKIFPKIYRNRTFIHASCLSVFPYSFLIPSLSVSLSSRFIHWIASPFFSALFFFLALSLSLPKSQVQLRALALHGPPSKRQHTHSQLTLLSFFVFPLPLLLPFNFLLLVFPLVFTPLSAASTSTLSF